MEGRHIDKGDVYLFNKETPDGGVGFEVEDLDVAVLTAGEDGVPCCYDGVHGAMSTIELAK